MKIVPLFKQRYSKIIIAASLLLIIFGYVSNNLFWGVESPIYFYRDSIMNIHWAVYYGKQLRNEELAYRPDLFQLLEDNNINRDTNIYYGEGYSDIFKGPISKKEKINISQLLKFHHPPLWFVFLGSLFWVFAFKLWVIYLAQTILGGVTIWLTYLVAKKNYSATTGLLSAFILSTLPSFLIITRQGFLETMVCPVMLIGVMLVERILKYPLKRVYYILFGLICGIGLLVKSAFLPYIIIFFLVIFTFGDKRKIFCLSFLRNLLISTILIVLIALPWYIYAHESLLDYSISSIDKGRTHSLLDIKSIFVMLPILKNVQLGDVLFILLILLLIRFCVKMKLPVFHLIFFLICGYLFTVLLPHAVIVRHFSPFLPLVIILICCGIIDLTRFKRWIIASLVILGFIHGYGWMIPWLPQLDQMRYFYDDIGTKKVKHPYSIYAANINSNNPFSSFVPLPKMRQREIYNKIKEIPFSSGLRLIKIINSNKHILEAKTLAGALSLYSMFESYPLIVESPDITKYKIFKDRIWVFLRNAGENVDLPSIDGERLRLKYVVSVPLTPMIICDIFRENRY